MKSTITKRSPIFILLSLLLAVAALGVGIFFGVSGKVSTGGGARLTYSYDLSTPLTAAEVKKAASGFSVQLGEAVDSDTEHQGVITLHSSKAVSSAQAEQATAALQSAFADASIEAKDVNLTLVRGGGSQLLIDALIAFLVIAVLVLVYCRFRFRRIGGWASGIVALWMTLQNLIITFGLMVLFGGAIDALALAQLAAVAAVSLVGPVVVLDAVRANFRLTSFDEIIETSVDQRQRIILAVGGLFAVLLAIFGIVVGEFLGVLPGILGLLLSIVTTLMVAPPLWGKLSHAIKE